jgi:integrase
VTEGDAHEFVSWLAGKQHLAAATVRRRTGLARQFFEHARRKGLIALNPFDGIPAAVHGNPDKFRFVTRAEATAILAACPDLEWRLLFALARFGGLRVPSEPLTMNWLDVDFERGRFKVYSPKTARYPGHALRVVPIFPELAPLLLEAFTAAEPGPPFVLIRPHWRERGASVNLRKGLAAIIERAGLSAWPKPWVNLRATRAIELRQEGFPDHVVNAWLGHSADVAAEHYLRVTETDFARAISVEPPQNVPYATHGKSAQPLATELAHEAQLPQSEALDDACASLATIGQKGPMGADGFEPS